MKDFVAAQALPMFNAVIRHRFVKFGCVGLLGTGVNLFVLYLGQEYLFRSIASDPNRLYFSLATAIVIATFHNYLWNRHWTWADRRRVSVGGFFDQLGKYYLSCTLAIAVQYVLTMILATWLHYMLANMTSIALSAILTYLMHEFWTFTHKTETKEMSGEK